MYQKIRVTSYSKSENLMVLQLSEKPGFINTCEIKLDSIRKDLCDIIDQTAFKAQTKDVLKVLLAGQKNALSSETREIFSKSGTGHLLAISGLHTGIVAAFFMVCFTFCFRRSTYLLNRARVVKTAAFLTLFLVVFYGFLTGMSDSTKRAVLMISVFLLSRFIDREPDSMNILALAGLIILVVDPCSLFSVSFLFSFTAVFFIILYLTGNELHSGDRLTEIGSFDKVRTWLVVFFQVTVISSLATLPLTAFFFNRISLLGIGVNLIVVPAAVFLIVPSGLLAVVVFFIYPPLSLFFIQVSGTLLEILISWLTWVSSLPYAEITVITPTIFQLVLGYVILVSVSFLMKKKGGIKPVVMIACSLIIFTGSAAVQVKYRFFRHDLVVTILDVGQGTSVLVEFPGDQVMLVDSGGFYSNDSFDVGKNILSRVLLKKGIKTIDTAVLSHPESDHYNGFMYLASHFSIKRFISNGDVSDSLGYQNLIKILSERSVSMPHFSDMETTWTVGGVKVEILHPTQEFLKEKPGKSSFNDHSIVVKLTHGDHTFLFPGDIMKQGEAELASRTHISLESQVLVVPHHGSKTSSSEVFLNRVNPEFAVFSSGFMNRYMPHKTILDRYSNRNINILRTDVEGAVTFRSDTRKLDVDLYYPHGHLFPLSVP